MHNRFFALAFIFSALFSSSSWATAEQAYHRVIQSQTMNCGYAEWPPFVVVDPGTKQVSGFMFELWEAIGKKLGLKINWKASSGWGEVIEAVNSNKIDVWCAGMGTDPDRIKNLLLSRPIFYNALYLWGRADDSRFDNHYEAVNNPLVTVVGQDGDVMASVLAEKFPQAKKANVSSSAQENDLVLSIITKKGDVALLDGSFAENYMKHHPGKIQQIKGAPISIISVVLPLAVGEYQLKNMIDTALNDLINDGTIAVLIKKYDTNKTYAPEPDVRIGKVGN